MQVQVTFVPPLKKQENQWIPHGLESGFCSVGLSALLEPGGSGETKNYTVLVNLHENDCHRMKEFVHLTPSLRLVFFIPWAILKCLSSSPW